MLVLPLVFGLLMAADPIPPGQAGYRPSGSLVELHDLARLARLRHPGVRPLVFLAREDEGGPDGTDPRPGDGPESLVVAEMAGPGILRRLRFARPAGERPGRHIRIYLDGRPEPALDLPLEALFGGRHPRFPAPLVGDGPGGSTCDVPIPFRDGCKVVVDGSGGSACRIDALALPDAEGVATFTEALPPSERPHLDRAVELWSHPEASRALRVPDAEKAVYVVDAIERTTLTFALPPGPKTIHTFELIPTPETADAWRSARLRLDWDGDGPAAAGVDLPVGFAFGRASRDLAIRSLLVGQAEGAWYLRFPMPYLRDAHLRLDCDRPIRGTIRLRTTPGTDADAGYFRAHYVEASPIRPDGIVPLLTGLGRGHYAGTFLASVGRDRVPPRLLEEGFQVAVDGESATRGTARGDDPDGDDRVDRSGRPSEATTYPSHGTIDSRTSDDGSPRSAAYRWHVADPIPYARSIDARLELGDLAALATELRATVFWYSEHPGPVSSGR